ncbi:RING-type E3 ubiquitin transferase [Balamuthia mandrillaris]
MGGNLSTGMGPYEVAGRRTEAEEDDSSAADTSTEDFSSGAEDGEEQAERRHGRALQVVVENNLASSSPSPTSSSSSPTTSSSSSPFSRFSMPSFFMGGGRAADPSFFLYGGEDDEDDSEEEQRTRRGGSPAAAAIANTTASTDNNSSAVLASVGGEGEGWGRATSTPFTRLIARPPMVHPTNRVRCGFCVKRESIRLMPVEHSPLPSSSISSTSTSTSTPVSPSSRSSSPSPSHTPSPSSSSPSLSSVSGADTTNNNTSSINRKGKQVADLNKQGPSSSPAHNLYQLRFLFDSEVECKITVYFMAKEKRDEENSLVGYQSQVGAPPPITLQFSPGLGQEYRLPLESAFDVSLYSPSELEPKPDSTTFPFIIVVEPFVRRKKVSSTSSVMKRRAGKKATTSSDKAHALPPKITSQTTFVTLLKCADDTYAAKGVLVKMEYGGVTYVVHDLFGLDQAEGPGLQRECVVCMSELSNTIVLPCRHMCLCQGCAEVLRNQANKCPICRTVFTSLLKVNDQKLQANSPLRDSDKKKKKKKTKTKKKKGSKTLNGKSSSTSTPTPSSPSHTPSSSSSSISSLQQPQPEHTPTASPSPSPQRSTQRLEPKEEGGEEGGATQDRREAEGAGDGEEMEEIDLEAGEADSDKTKE